MAAIRQPFGRPARRRSIDTGALVPRFRLPGLPVLRVNWWILGALMLVGATAMLPVVQTSSATTTGFDIQQLQAQRTRLQNEIALIERDIATARSLDRIETRAGELGLVAAVDPVYVEIGAPGPAPARLPAEYQPDPRPVTREPEPWWRSALRAIPFLPGTGPSAEG